MKIDAYVYRCSAGETFDGIALALFGDEKYAAELMTVNPAHCHLMQFYGGELLVLPVIDESENADVSGAPWR